MDNAGNRAVLILVEGVVRFVAAAELFVHRGHHGAAQRLLGDSRGRVDWRIKG